MIKGKNPPETSVTPPEEEKLSKETVSEPFLTTGRTVPPLLKVSQSPKIRQGPAGPAEIRQPLKTLATLPPWVENGSDESARGAVVPDDEKPPPQAPPYAMLADDNTSNPCRIRSSLPRTSEGPTESQSTSGGLLRCKGGEMPATVGVEFLD